ELACIDGEYFLVMEYLEGESVGGLMRRAWVRREPLDRLLSAHIIAEACAGLHAAHELTDATGASRHVVHRDVSPQNVMVTYAGEVKVLDFGVAKAADSARTQGGQVKGKCEYMSPEQCRSEPLDRRSDVFSLGILLYELTLGCRLFKRDSALLAFYAICHEPIPPPAEIDPTYPPALAAICARALAPDRGDRYPSMLEMRRDLVAAIRGLAGAERRASEDEALAGLMTRIFADRIDEKREMIRRARAGSSIERIPAAEADAQVELPDVPRAAVPPPPPAPRREHAPPPPARRAAAAVPPHPRGGGAPPGSWGPPWPPRRRAPPPGCWGAASPRRPCRGAWPKRPRSPRPGKPRPRPRKPRPRPRRRGPSPSSSIRCPRAPRSASTASPAAPRPAPSRCPAARRRWRSPSCATASSPS